MNSSNALGFAIFGLSLKFLPVWFPTMMGTSSPESVRSLWMGLMSFVLMAIAGSFFMSRAWVTRGMWAGWAIRPMAAASVARRQAASALPRAGVSV